MTGIAIVDILESLGMQLESVSAQEQAEYDKIDDESGFVYTLADAKRIQELSESPIPGTIDILDKAIRDIKKIHGLDEEE